MASLSVAESAPDRRFPNPVRNEQHLYQWCLERLYELDHYRKPWEYLWRHAWQLVAPSREDTLQWFESNYGNRGGGRRFVENIGRHIYDTTAPAAVQILVAAMQGYTVSQQERWFQYGLPRREMEELPGVRAWLQEVEQQAYHDFARGTFYDQMPSLMLDGIVCGTATQRHIFDDDTERNVFETLHPLEIYLDQNHLHEIDLVFRVFHMTRRQALQFFPEHRLSPQIMRSRDFNQEFQFLHAVFPRSEHLETNMGLYPWMPDSPLAMDAKWISIYMELPDGWRGSGGSDRWGNRNDHGRDHLGEQRQNNRNQGKRVLAWGGYRQFPYLVWRWETDGNHVYGTSPTRKMLPNITQANFYSKLTKTGAYWAINPAWSAPARSRDMLRLYPGGITYQQSDPYAKIEAITTNLQHYPIGIDREERMAMSIKQLYGTDIFTLFSDITKDGKTRTATEIFEAQGEKAAVLSSTNGRLNRDYFDLCHDIIVWQAMMRGAIPPPPPALYQYFGSDLARFDVDYIGPLAQAQRRLYRVQNTVRALELMLPVAQFNPTIFDYYNVPKMGERIGLGLGLESDLMYTDSEVAEQRRQAAEKQAQQEQLANLESAGRAARGFGGVAELAQVAGGVPEGQVPTALPAPPARVA